MTNNIDKIVGQAIRKRRLQLGLSQSQLAEAVGVTFQQIQKYERGTNRVGASRLFEISQVLETDINSFFQDSSDGQAQSALNPGFAEDKAGYQAEDGGSPRMDDREILSLARAFQRIKNRDVRKNIIAMVRSIAE